MNSYGNGHSRLDAGEVLITFGDESHILSPTMRKHRMISRRFGGLNKARQAIVDEDIDAILFIIITGSDLSDREQKGLEDRVWKSGIDFYLLMPLYRYLAILNNGGRPLDEDTERALGGGSVIEADAIEDHTSGNG